MSEDQGNKDKAGQQGGISGGFGQVNVPGKASFGGDFHDNSGPGAGSNVTGTQNNVQGNQFNSDRDQFIGNRNVSTGEGTIHDYGGVGGNVNSGSGSQTNIRAGDISGNSGNIGLGSNINQSYSSGAAGADPKVNALLTALEDLRDNLDNLTGDDRKSVRDPLTTAIKSLRTGQLDSITVGHALQQASNALADLDRGEQRQALKNVAVAAGLNIR